MYGWAWKEHQAGRTAQCRLFAEDRLRRRLFAAIIEEYRRHPELAGAADVVDLSALFDDRTEPVYIDFYHLSEEGNAAVTEAMLPAINAACAERISGIA